MCYSVPFICIFSFSYVYSLHFIACAKVFLLILAISINLAPSHGVCVCTFHCLFYDVYNMCIYKHQHWASRSWPTNDEEHFQHIHTWTNIHIYIHINVLSQQLCSRAFECSHTCTPKRAQTPSCCILFIVKSFTKSIEYKCQGFWFNFGVLMFWCMRLYSFSLVLSFASLVSVSFARIHKYSLIHSFICLLICASSVCFLLTQFNVLHHFSSRFYYVRKNKFQITEC